MEAVLIVICPVAFVILIWYNIRKGTDWIRAKEAQRAAEQEAWKRWKK